MQNTFLLKRVALKPGPGRSNLSWSIVIALLLFAKPEIYGTTRTSVTTGNWSNPATWSPSGVPTSTDSVIIHGGTTVTVDNVFTCNNVDIDDVTSGATTLNITTSGNSLTINGNLRINPFNLSSTCILDAGPGSINIAGTFSDWSTSGTTSLKVAAGTLTITPAVSITSANQTLNIYGAGIVNFNSSYTDNYNKLLTCAGCIVNFNNSYIVTTTAANWNNKGKAVFSGAGSITPNANITFWDIQMNGTAITTLASGAGAVDVSDSFTLASGSSFTANQGFEVDGNWTNFGGTLNGGTNTIIFGYWGRTFGGTAPTTFPIMQFGKAGGNTVGYTTTTNNSCAGIIFTGYANAGTLTIGTGDTFAVNGNVTINQPTGSVTNALLVNGGVCTVSGNLNFTGTNNTSTYIGKVTVTSGSLTLGGTVNWSANTAVATEVITVSTGTITFNSPVIMGSGSGTLSVTSTGTVNFMGSSPSFTFGGATSPVLATSAGSTLNIQNGFINNTNAFIFNVSSNVIFTGNGTLTPNAPITFGNLQVSASASDTLSPGGGAVDIVSACTLNSGSAFIANQNFEVDGNWINNGGTLSGTNDTIILAGNPQTITGTSATTFPTILVGNANAIPASITMSNTNSCTNLIFGASTKARTFTFGTGTTLAVSGNVIINQPSAGNTTNTLAVNGGTCNVSGNLIFIGTSNSNTEVAKVGVTSGAFTLNGSVTWMASGTVATEVITVSTGTITFGSSLTMGSGSGTLTVTSTGTINFSGTTSPSFNFGGAATSPVFTTSNGCTLNFADGFANNTNALALNAGSLEQFTGNGSITPNANIIFGSVQFSGTYDTLNAGAGTAVVAGSLTVVAGDTFALNQSIEVRGNWVNNGGALNSGSYSVIMNGNAQTIGGTSSTTFTTLQIGNTSVANTVICTMDNNTTCTNLVFNGYSDPRTFILSTGTTLTVNGNVTINQPTGSATNNLEVNEGTCTISGNLNYVGTSNTTSYIGRVTVTSGSLTINGSVNWGSNSAVATEVISVTTGTLTFNSSLNMGAGSGTLIVSGAATVNFNGTTAPSFNFGASTNSPSFATAAGCTLNFANGFTNNGLSLILANLSNAVFTGTSTVTPGAAITFGNVLINSGATMTLAGNIFITGNWTDNGLFAPGTNAVTFDGASPAVQTISDPNGETFYKLSGTITGNTTQFNCNVTVTDLLTMSGPNINLNGYTLQLGNNAGASLSYTSGTVYGGTWKRWLPVTGITSGTSLEYGLIPLGTSTAYMPVTINSAVNPTTAGYIIATNSYSLGVTLVNYTDNEGATIQVISNMNSTLTTSGLAGGTYTIACSFSGFANVGAITDLKLETYTGGVMGSAGTTVASTGTVGSPTVSRSGLAATQLANVFVVGSKNINNTPLQQFYYSRKSGNWNDVSSGNSTWSLTPGGSGASCNCIPTSAAYVSISPGQTVTVDTNASVNYLVVDSTGVLNDDGTNTLTVSNALTLLGNGMFANSSNWTLSGTLTLASSSACTGRGTMTIDGATTIPAGGNYTQTSGTLTMAGNLVLQGTVSLGTATFNLTGSGTYMSGNGSITSGGSSILTITNNKNIPAGSTITIGSVSAPLNLALSGALSFTNNGAAIINGNLTGSVSGSTWINAANSSLQLTGNLLTTGTLNTSASPNTVIYNANGAQTVAAPATGYYNLTIANGGTKTLSGNVAVSTTVTIQDSATLDMTTYALTGNADAYMTGKSQMKLTRNIAGYYPEINGNYYFSGGTVTINQTSGTCTVNSGTYYNLVLSGTRPYDISGVPVILNNFYIQDSSAIINNIALTVMDSLIYTSKAASTLNDDVTAASITLSAGALNDGGNGVTVTGSGGWSNSGCSYKASGDVIFVGAVAQNIGGSTATLFNNFYLDNPGGVTLALNPAAATMVGGTLYMNDGILYTNSTNILQMNYHSSSIGASAKSYVSGPMIKIGNDNFVFPLGQSGRYMAAGISDLTDTLNTVQAQYFFTPYTNLAPLSSPLAKVSGVEYWMIERTNSTDSLKLSLYWQDASISGLESCSGLNIAHWLNNQWVEVPATVSGGSSCTTGNGSVQSTGFISSFSPFTFGSNNGMALPIQLVQFNAAVQSNAVITTWSTEVQINNNYFTIERSDDAVNFSEIGRENGAGNSTALLQYEFTDENPLKGVSYYRLRQTDDNGNYTFSDIVSVNFTSSGAIKLYPNPASGQVFINVSSPSEQIEVNIYNMTGQLAYSRIFAGDENNSSQTISIPVMGVLPSGMYVVCASANGINFRQQLVVY